MKTVHVLLVCVVLFASNCTKITLLTRYKPAELKERRAGLYLKEFEKQKEIYNTAVQSITLHPDSVTNYLTLAKVFIKEAKVTGEHPYYYPAALATLDVALDKDEKNPEAMMLKTSVLLSLHQFAEAKSLAQSCLQVCGPNSQLYGMLCDANVELGNYTDAIQCVDMMMNIRPGLDAYSRASYLRELHGDVNGAIDAMQLATKAGLPGTEDAAWTRVTLGNIYCKQQRFHDAKVQYMLALQERNNYPFALAGLAQCIGKEGNPTLALSMLDSALQTMPELSFLEKKAEIEFEQGNLLKVNEYVHQMDSMMDEDAKAGHKNDAERALIYCKLNVNPKQALDFATKEIAYRPNNITAQFAMAFALYRNNNISESRTYLSKAMRLNKQDKDFMSLYSMINSSQNLSSTK